MLDLFENSLNLEQEAYEKGFRDAAINFGDNNLDFENDDSFKLGKKCANGIASKLGKIKGFLSATKIMYERQELLTLSEKDLVLIESLESYISQIPLNNSDKSWDFVRAISQIECKFKLLCANNRHLSKKFNFDNFDLSM